MEGDVLAIAVTPTEKLLAVALIDSSIQGNNIPNAISFTCSLFPCGSRKQKTNKK